MDQSYLDHFSAALDTVAKKKLEHGHWISDEDWEKFSKIVTECESRTTTEKEYIVDNKSNMPHRTPLSAGGSEHNTHETKNDVNVNVEAGGNASAKENIGAKTSVNAGYEHVSTKKDETEQKWSEHTRLLPPQTKLEEKHYTVTTVSTVTFSCRADFVIRVYNQAPLKVGAGAGGAVGGGVGAVGGAAAGIGAGVVAGTAAGAGAGAGAGGIAAIFGASAAGAAAGSFAPGIGTAVGLGVGFGIGLVIAIAGTGIGAGIGAAVMNETHEKITVEEIFQEFNNFQKKGKEVFCDIRIPQKTQKDTEVVS